MSYFDDYGDKKSKIPYDDVPITRNESTQRNYGAYRLAAKTSRFTTMVIAFMLAVNFVLTIVCLSLITNTKVRIINNYVAEVGTNTGLSSLPKNLALLSSCAITAGEDCGSAENFYSKKGCSRGSGVIYKVENKSEGSRAGTIYFVTCYHVVSSSPNSVYVMLSSSLEPIGVELVGFSSRYDLAVLKCESDDVELTLNGSSSVSVFDSVYIGYGETVFAIGNSLAGGLSVTEGLISQINKEIEVADNNYTSRLLQISAEINPGNSGGGLFNDNGEFIGIVSAKVHSAVSNNTQFTVVGTSYAIPSSLVRGIADDLIGGESKAKKVDIGITFENDASQGKQLMQVPENEYGNVDVLVDKYSVVVSNISSSSPAAKSSLFGDGLEIGDEILAIEFWERDAQKSRKVTMYNKFTFDDYAFSIQKGSDITIYYKKKTDNVNDSPRTLTFAANTEVLVS